MSLPEHQQPYVWVNWDMSFWDHLQRFFYSFQRPERTFRFEGELLESLQELAALEQRSEEEVAADLLANALALRQVDVERMRLWQELTPREQQMAALTCLGYTNRQIASRLRLSPDTVKSHLRSTLRKFGVSTKSDLRQLLADWDFSGWD